MVCAACCRTALVFAIMHLHNGFSILYYFCAFLASFNLAAVDNLDRMVAVPARPSIMCSFNRGNIEGTNSSKKCVRCLCIIYVSFYVCVGIDFVDLT